MDIRCKTKRCAHLVSRHHAVVVLVSCSLSKLDTEGRVLTALNTPDNDCSMANKEDKTNKLTCSSSHNCNIPESGKYWAEWSHILKV